MRRDPGRMAETKNTDLRRSRTRTQDPTNRGSSSSRGSGGGGSGGGRGGRDGGRALYLSVTAMPQLDRVHRSSRQEVMNLNLLMGGRYFWMDRWMHWQLVGLCVDRLGA